MKVKELREETRKHTKNELETMIVELYKQIPASKKEIVDRTSKT